MTLTFEQVPERLRDYVVAVRKIDHGAWPKQYQAILMDARTKYNAGTHEMVQGRGDGVVFQYCIPRKEPTAPRRYFLPTQVAKGAPAWVPS